MEAYKKINYHDNILTLIDCVLPEYNESDFINGNKDKYFVYEFVDGSNLFTLVAKHGKPGFSEPIARYFFK